MAVFYVLPPRSLFGTQLAKSLQSLLPGLSLRSDVCLDWLQNSIAESGADVYLVHREDLPEGDIGERLRDAFGAEDGDRVVQVTPGALADRPQVRSWQVETVDSPVRLAAFV